MADISFLNKLECDRCSRKGLLRIKNTEDLIVCPKCAWEWRTADFEKDRASSHGIKNKITAP